MPGRGKKRVRESEGDTNKVVSKKHKSKSVRKDNPVHCMCKIVAKVDNFNWLVMLDRYRYI